MKTLLLLLFLSRFSPSAEAQLRVVSVEDVPGVVGTYPSWSPDGRTLAFERDGDLFTVSIDGSGEVGLAHHPSLDETPVWSPSGEILFASVKRCHSARLTVASPGRLGTVRLDINHAAADGQSH